MNALSRGGDVQKASFGRKRSSLKTRSTLSASVSVAVLLAMSAGAQADPDPCVTLGGLLLCTGDQSDGIDEAIDASTIGRTVFIGGLSGDIDPDGPGVAVDLAATGPQTVNVFLDLEPFGISIFDDISEPGLTLDTVNPRSQNLVKPLPETVSTGLIITTEGDLFLDVDGDITSSDEAVILESANGSVDATFNGNVTANADGSTIVLIDNDTLDATAEERLRFLNDHSIDVAQEDGITIVAETGVSLFVDGDVSAIGDAIEIDNQTGIIDVTVNGDINSGNVPFLFVDDEIAPDGQLISSDGESGIEIRYRNSSHVKVEFIGDANTFEETIEINREANVFNPTTVPNTLGPVLIEYFGVGDLNSGDDAAIKINADQPDATIIVNHTGRLTSNDDEAIELIAGLDYGETYEALVNNTVQTLTVTRGVTPESRIELTYNGTILGDEDAIQIEAKNGTVSANLTGFFSGENAPSELPIGVIQDPTSLNESGPMEIFGDLGVDVIINGDAIGYDDGIKLGAQFGDVNFTMVGDVTLDLRPEPLLRRYRRFTDLQLASEADSNGRSDLTEEVFANARSNPSAFEALLNELVVAEFTTTNSADELIYNRPNDGIEVENTGGNVTIDYTGNITAVEDGMQIETFGYECIGGYDPNCINGERIGGNVTINMVGDLVNRIPTYELLPEFPRKRDDGYDVTAYGNIIINHRGLIDTGEDGDDGYDLDGTITAPGGFGSNPTVDALDSQMIMVNHWGDLRAGGNGYVIDTPGQASVFHTGDMTVGDDGYDFHGRILTNPFEWRPFDFVDVPTGDVEARADQLFTVIHRGNLVAGADGYRVGAVITPRASGFDNSIDPPEPVEFIGTPVPIRARGGTDFTHIGDLTVEGDGFDIFTENAVGIDFQGALMAGDEAYDIDTFGDVNIMHIGDITTQSDGFKVDTTPGDDGDDDGDVSILFTGGTLDVNANAIEIFTDLGRANTFENWGSIPGNSNFTVVTGEGDETFTNFGLMAGDMEFGAGTNVFNNFLGGTLITGSHFLDTGSLSLNNSGTWSIGAVGEIITTNSTATVSQTSTGNLWVDVDAGGGPSDLFDTSGGAAFAGLVTPTVQNLTNAPFQEVVVQAASSVVNNGAMANDSLAVDYSLFFNDPSNNMGLIIDDVDFTAPGVALNANQQGLGDALNDIFDNGEQDPIQDVVDQLANIRDPNSYRAALSAVGPDIYLTIFDTILSSNLAFAGSLENCRDTAYDPEDPTCGWAEAGVRGIGGGPAPGYEGTLAEMFIGAEYARSMQSRFGFGVGYTNVANGADFGGSVDGSIFHAGLFGTFYNGPWTLMGTFSGGLGNFDVTHGIVGTSTVDGPMGSPTSAYVAAEGEIGYKFDAGSVLIEPRADFGLVYTRLNGLTESGSGALSIDASNSTAYYASPEIAIYAKEAIGLLDFSFKPYGNVGFTWIGGHDPEVTAQFSQVAGPATPFTTSGDFDNLFGTLTLGAAFGESQGILIRTEYEGRIGENSWSHGGSVKAAVRF